MGRCVNNVFCEMQCYYLDMLIIQLLFLIFLLWVTFWQGSMLWAAIIGAPIVYTTPSAIRDAWKFAGLKPGQTVIDLGCGNARSLIIAAREFGAKGIGVDRSVFCVLKSRLNVWLTGQSKNIKIIQGDFHKVEKEITEADFVYVYLLNKVLSEIEPWLFDTIGNKTEIVSMAFQFPVRVPVKECETVNLGNKTKIRIYSK